MFKFIKQYAEKMQQVDIYPVFSLVIFFIFFTVLLIAVKKLGKAKADEWAGMPLDNETVNTIN